MNRRVYISCAAGTSHRRAVAVFLVFVTLFISTAIAAPALASLREESSLLLDDELPVGLAGQHFILSIYETEAFVFFDGSRALKQASLVIIRPYRAPPIPFSL